MAFPDKPVSHLLGSNGPVHALTYSASPGTYVLAGSADRSIRLYNPVPSTAIHPSSHIHKKSPSSTLPEGRLIQTYSAHGYEVLSLTCSSDNARFASSGGDRSVFLWDVATAQTIRRFGGNQGHVGRINVVSFAGHDDSLVLSGGLDCAVRIWDLKSNSMKPVQILSEAKDSITSMVVRGPEIMSGSVDGKVRTYDVRMGKMTEDTIGASVTSLSLTKDGNALLVGSLDSKVRLFDRDTGSCLKSYGDPQWKNEDFRVQSVLGGKEKYVLAGDEMKGSTSQHGEGHVWAWDMLSGKIITRLQVPWGPAGSEPRKKVVGRDGKEKERSNVVSCITWQDNGFGDQFCVSGTSGVVTVYGYR